MSMGATRAGTMLAAAPLTGGGVVVGAAVEEVVVGRLLLVDEAELVTGKRSVSFDVTRK